MLFANSVLAADVAAGLAARLDAGLNWDLVDVELTDGELVGKRPALQDSVSSTSAGRSTPRLALFRAGSFDATPRGGGEPAGRGRLTPSYEAHSQRREDRRARTQEESSGPSIEDADVIVAGGRGLGAPENFTLAEELAKALGGAVGATRAVVDAGWYPYSAQIGQTGKTVSPKLYVALGISGAIQHKVGMQNSNVIVAINKDPNAPIFEFSDLGVVGDVHEIVPEAHRARRASARAADGAAVATSRRRSRRASSSPSRPTRSTSGSRSACSSSAPARPASPARSASASCSRSIPTSPSGSATCRSPCSRRASSPARTCCRARSSTRARCRRLFGDRYRMDDLPSYGPVARRVRLRPHAAQRRCAIPPPPTMRNHGNWIFSLSQLGRWLAERAEEGGAMILPETAAQKLLVSDGRVVGVRTGDKGRGRDGEPSSATSSPAPTSSPR